MDTLIPRQIRPGMFSKQVAADSRRLEFDSKNEELLYMHTDIDCLFIGDSITHAWELGAYFVSGGKRLVNRGIGGDTPYYIEKRLDADVLQLHPKCVLLLCGINETWSLDKETNRSRMDEAATECCARILGPIHKIAQRCAAAGQQIGLCSLLPVYGEDTPPVNQRKRLILEVNRELCRLCGGTAFYVDYHSVLAEQDGCTLQKTLSADGCHPNASGYQCMAGQLCRVLRERDIEI